MITQQANEATCEFEKLIDEAEKRVADETRRRSYDTADKIEEQNRKAANAKHHTDRGDNYPLETGMKRTDIVLDLPEFKVDWKETDIATVHITLKNRDVEYITVGRCEIGKTKVPEFEGYKVSFKLRAITVPCPKSATLVLKVPEFTAGTTKIRVPQFTVSMEQRKLSFHVPQFTIRDYDEEKKEARKAIERLEEDLRKALDNLTKEELRHTAEAIRVALARRATEAQAKLEEQERAALSSIGQAREQLGNASREASRTLRGAGAQTSEADDIFRASTESLLQYERKIRAAFDDARARLNETLNEVAERYLVPLRAEFGYPFCIRKSTPVVVTPQ
jgi:hypothetical protein